MNIQIHDNGWTVIVNDFDIKHLSQDDAKVITKYLLTNTVVVFKNQKLTTDEEINISKMFGNVENHFEKNAKDNFIISNTDGKIVRVTGELNDQGLPGVFGHEDELEWHCNRVSDPDRKPFVWLYSKRGSVGSRTSYLNNILSYNDLEDDEKIRFKEIRLNVGEEIQFTNYLWREGVSPPKIENYRPKLVYTNELGITGLFFSWNQIHFIEGMSPEDGRKFINDLRERVEQEKYIYHHDWEDGDIVIAEQNLSIHKRWAFKHMDKRLLHRITFDYSNINLTQ